MNDPEKRLHEAAETLEETAEQVKEVAGQVGATSPDQSATPVESPAETHVTYSSHGGSAREPGHGGQYGDSYGDVASIDSDLSKEPGQGGNY
jgi:hypothetical protein